MPTTNARIFTQVQWNVVETCNLLDGCLVRKLRLDLGRRVGLRVVMDDDERAELISRMFALITMKCEDAAAIAATGQGKRKSQQHRELAGQLLALSEECATVAAATISLLPDKK